jgi:hypothetical protein
MDPFDPFDPATVRDPRPTCARLPTTTPVAHGDRWGGFRTLTRAITPAGPPEMTRRPEYGPVGLPVRLDTVIP